MCHMFFSHVLFFTICVKSIRMVLWIHGLTALTSQSSQQPVERLSWLHRTAKIFSPVLFCLSLIRRYSCLNFFIFTLHWSIQFLRILRCSSSPQFSQILPCSFGIHLAVLGWNLHSKAQSASLFPGLTKQPQHVIQIATSCHPRLRNTFDLVRKCPHWHFVLYRAELYLTSTSTQSVQYQTGSVYSQQSLHRRFLGTVPYCTVLYRTRLQTQCKHAIMVRHQQEVAPV